MKFKFDANQEFQIAAIEAVVDLFQGQARISGGIEFLASDNLQIATSPNRLDLDDAALLENLREVQRRNSIRTNRHREAEDRRGIRRGHSAAQAATGRATQGQTQQSADSQQ